MAAHTLVELLRACRLGRGERPHRRPRLPGGSHGASMNRRRKVSGLRRKAALCKLTAKTRDPKVLGSTPAAPIPRSRNERESWGCTLPGYFTMERTHRRKRGKRGLGRLNQPLGSKTSTRFIRCVRSRIDRQHGAATSRAGVGTAPARKPHFRLEAKLLRSAESSAKWRPPQYLIYYAQSGRGCGRISRLTLP